MNGTRRNLEARGIQKKDVTVIEQHDLYTRFQVADVEKGQEDYVFTPSE